MTTSKRNQLSEIFKMAWSFVRQNGYSLSEALKCAWANVKLRIKMKSQIVQFFFKKVDGSMRQAFGTLSSERVLATSSSSNRKPNPDVSVYFDTEKEEWRCFKKCNLVKVL